MTGTIAVLLEAVADAIRAATAPNRGSHDDTYHVLVDLPDLSRSIGTRTVWVSAIPARRPVETSRSCDTRETIAVVTHHRPDAKGALLALLLDADVILDALYSWGVSAGVQVLPELGDVQTGEGTLVATRQIRLVWERS